MAIPIITDHFLGMVCLHPDTEPETNSFVNTWYFRNDDPLGTHEDTAVNIMEVLNAFYNDINGSSTIRISSALSPVVNHTTATIRVYDLGQAPPRVPIIKPLTLNAPTAGNPLPNECSVVLSYRSGPAGSAGGTSNRRARGRIYIGPLNANAQLAYSAGALDSFVAGSFVTAVAEGAKNVEATTQPVTWRQYSRAANTMETVTGGFVNNAFDTQRRRGADAGSRTVWP